MSDVRADETDEGPNDAAELAIEAAQVEDVLRAIGAALRSYRLYAGQGPALERFVETARAKLLSLWEHVSMIRLDVDEQSMRWEGARVYPTGDSGPELAFAFYKDGIREITFLPGFEDELQTFLKVVGRAPQVRADEDDLITLLWQEDFTAFQYDFVESGNEGVELSDEASTTTESRAPVSPESVREAAAEPSAGITPEDFQETLYFLDESELQRLADEVKREAARDLWAGVLTALYDRIEDGSPERQERILSVIGEILPSLLGAAEFERASGLLSELADLAAKPGLLSATALRKVRELFAQLASGDAIGQLVRLVEGDPDVLRKETLGALFNFFPPEALAPLARASATISRPDVRRAFEGVVERLAGDNREEVVRLLADDDPRIVESAARWVGELRIGAATSTLLERLSYPEAGVRLAALEALVSLRAAMAGKAIEALLEDPDREVRVAAARGLASLEFTAARGALEAALQSKRLRAADRSEKIAFFEAYGRVGGAEAVPLLDRTLNARSWLGRGESAEIRACAALGLARVRHPNAKTALAAAQNDSDPVVRSAVARALRGEEGA